MLLISLEPIYIQVKPSGGTAMTWAFAYVHFYFYAKKDVHKTKQNFSLLHIVYNEISLAKPLFISCIIQPICKFSIFI